MKNVLLLNFDSGVATVTRCDRQGSKCRKRTPINFKACRMQRTLTKNNLEMVTKKGLVDRIDVSEKEEVYAVNFSKKFLFWCGCGDFWFPEH